MFIEIDKGSSEIGLQKYHPVPSHHQLLKTWYNIIFLLKTKKDITFMKSESLQLLILGKSVMLEIINENKDLRGNPKTRVSPDRTGQDLNQSGIGTHFLEYFRVASGRG